MTNAPIAASDLDKALDTALSGTATISATPAQPPSKRQDFTHDQITIAIRCHNATLVLPGVESISLFWNGDMYVASDGGYPRVRIASDGGTLEDGRSRWSLVRSRER